MFAVSCAAAMAMAGSASASSGNSGAAQECQNGGYLSMSRSDGSSFKNAGACVSYFAQGGTSACGTVVSGGSGCVLFDNAFAPVVDLPGETIDVNGAFAFSTTACVSLICTAPNDYATGGGTIAFYENGAPAGSVTFTAADTPGSKEGLIQTGYVDASGNATTCAAASSWGVVVQVSATGTINGDPVSGTWTLHIGDQQGSSSLAITFDTGGAAVFEPMTGLTISC